jgi:hypothetical protein
MAPLLGLLLIVGLAGIESSVPFWLVGVSSLRMDGCLTDNAGVDCKEWLEYGGTELVSELGYECLNWGRFQLISSTLR